MQSQIKKLELSLVEAKDAAEKAQGKCSVQVSVILISPVLTFLYWLWYYQNMLEKRVRFSYTKSHSKYEINH